LPEENDKLPGPEGRSEKPKLSPENDERVKIYFLPNLLTAGNLASGFFALTWIFQVRRRPRFRADPDRHSVDPVGLCLRLPRWKAGAVGEEGVAFGREFDSLADIVSFGVAPAFLVYRIVLLQFRRSGWVIAAIYLVCGGIRLARFNVLTMRPESHKGLEFVGFPIPSAAAAGGERDDVHDVDGVARGTSWGRHATRAPGLMVLLSILMVSTCAIRRSSILTGRPARSVAAFGGRGRWWDCCWYRSSR